jgi:hypothetical protein
MRACRSFDALTGPLAGSGIGPASAERPSFALLYRLLREQTRRMSNLDVF